MQKGGNVVDDFAISILYAKVSWLDLRSSSNSHLDQQQLHLIHLHHQNHPMFLYLHTTATTTSASDNERTAALSAATTTCCCCTSTFFVCLTTSSNMGRNSSRIIFYTHMGYQCSKYCHNPHGSNTNAISSSSFTKDVPFTATTAIHISTTTTAECTSYEWQWLESSTAISSAATTTHLCGWNESWCDGWRSWSLLEHNTIAGYPVF
mmetsp:Transcript_15011/g.22242  ORF Transcript_15011/g.22242 Transcript_15011/m.22242 type:complete len:207 (+) Transcript_15011:234-854(+)